MEEKRPKRQSATTKKLAAAQTATTASSEAPKRASRSKAAVDTAEKPAPKRAAKAKTVDTPAEKKAVTKVPRTKKEPAELSEKAAAKRASRVKNPAEKAEKAASKKAERLAKAATASETAAPKKTARGAATPKGKKGKAESQKKENKTPFWAPFARPEKPKRIAREVEEKNDRRDPAPRFEDERPSRKPAPQRDERPSRTAAPRRPERPSHNDERRNSNRSPERPQRPAQSGERRHDDQSENTRDARQEGRFSRPERPASQSNAERRFEKPFRNSPTGKSAAKPAKLAKLDEPMRLNKFLSHCGVAARRQSAEYVKNGLVTVNGVIEANPGYLVQLTDEVRFKGEVVRLEERKVYILMNKPRDIITTSNDEKGRRTVLDLIGEKVEERIFPVGRLDRMTSGLLLLTNDGDLAKKLSHPSHMVQKVYHVTLDKPFHKADFEKVQKGLNLEDGPAQVDSLHYIEGSKIELEIGLHIGRNRIVRRIFEHLGYEVVKLDRTYYAGLTKKDIGRGHFRHLTEQEIIMLKHFK